MGEIIKMLARREGITLTELARRVNKTLNDVSMNLRTDIKTKKFLEYAKALGYKVVLEKKGERIEL
jgi:hypothetical protein